MMKVKKEGILLHKNHHTLKNGGVPNPAFIRQGDRVRISNYSAYSCISLRIKPLLCQFENVKIEHPQSVTIMTASVI
jgi:hypothetical protein